MAHHKSFFLFFFIFLGLHLLFIGTTRIYPLVDLPMHLASATIVRYYHDTDNSFDEYYFIKKTLGRPNTFHLLFCSLKVFPSVEGANRIFYLLYVSLLPLSTLLLIRRLGGNPWYSLLSFLLLYNFSVSWGFTGYTISIPFVLLFLHFLYSFHQKPDIWNSTLIFLLPLIVFCMHALTALYCVTLCGATLFMLNRRTIKKTALSYLLIAPSALIVGYWFIKHLVNSGGGGDSISLMDYYRSAFLITLKHRLGFFIWDNFALFEGKPGIFLASFFSLFILCFALLPGVLAIKKVRPSSLPMPIILTFLGVSLFWYVFLPRVESFDYSYFRYSVFCLLAITILGSKIDVNVNRSIRYVFLCIVVAVHLVCWADYFRRFNRDNAMFTGDIFPESKTSRLAGIISDYKYRGQPIYIHFPDYHIIWNRGIATAKFIDIPEVWRIGRKVDTSILPRYNEWIGRVKNDDLRYLDMDYLIVRGDIGGTKPLYDSRFAVVKTARPWVLLRNRQAERASQK